MVWYEQKLKRLPVAKEHLQPIRFQGQSFDTETGLHYNRFRYFDPDLGMFTTRDPIGLMGGNNVFQYAPNPTGWIDPFGLSAESVYRLLDSSGKTIYYGITERLPSVRGAEHIDSGKIFSKMEVLAEGLTHDQARTIEGALIRNKISPSDIGESVETQLKNAGLLNKNRGRVTSRWISNNPLEELRDKFLPKPRNVDIPKSKCNT